MSTKKMEVEVELHQPEGKAGTEEAWQAQVTDRNRSRAWSGTARTPGAATTEAVRRFLGDRRSREYVASP